MDNNILGTYVNGNTIVAIYKDGTKERYVKDGEVAMPVFPESIDLKITNMCNIGCHFCAESSTPDGAHADLFTHLLYTIQPYTELAIGGGNPLEHPGLLQFLEVMKHKHVICNMTVNSEHFMKNLGFIRYLQDNGLIHGLGVSVPAELQYGLIDKIKNYKNIVISHFNNLLKFSLVKFFIFIITLVFKLHKGPYIEILILLKDILVYLTKYIS